MKRQTTITLLLSLTLSCNGLLEKLFDPLNLGGAIKDKISSHIHKVSGVLNIHGSGERPQQQQYSEYSNNYGYGSSGGSYSHQGSVFVDGNAGQFQSYGNGGSPQNYGYHQTSQVSEQIIPNAPEPTTIYVISSEDNSYNGAPQGVSYGHSQYNNGYGTGNGGSQHSGSAHLTFNLNLGGLFNHKHGHPHPDIQNVNNNQYPEGQVISINGQNPTQIKEYEITIITQKPNHGNYQNQNNYQTFTNVHETKNEEYHSEFNSNSGNSYVPIPNEKYEDNGNYNSGNNYQSNNNYNTYHNQNQNPGLPVQNPIQDERNGVPNEEDYSNGATYVSSEPTPVYTTEALYLSSTESSKTPYENEKNSKVTTSNRKTTVRPDTDQPLLVPLNPNEFVYEGDKISIAAPKRNAEEASSTTTTTTTSTTTSTQEPEYDLDVRFGKDK